MPVRVYLTALGCRLNQAEIERMAARLQAAGHRLVAEPGDADWVVVNSCTVTGRADADSRALLRRLHREAPAARIAVTGCWSTLQAERAAASPGVALVVANRDKESLVERIAPGVGAAEGAREAIPGPRRRARAFLAVQDGCDRACAFCLTTQARGPSRSSSMASVVASARAAEAGGAQELVLCGVQLAAWGRDLPGRLSLADLVEALLAGTEQARLRLSSLTPWGLPEGLLYSWRHPRLCPSLHLSLQSGCDATLARMARGGDRASAAALIERARDVIPGLAVSADLLVGFPGETEGELEETLAWVEALDLADAHVFGFSPRPGTVAATLHGQVPGDRIRARRAAVLAVVEGTRRRFRAALVGEHADVIWVGHRVQDDGSFLLQGVDERGVPVRALADQDRWGQRERVRIVGLDGDDVLHGVVA